MPEPTSSAAVTIAAATAAVPALTVFGIATGLRPDILLAGFAGALVAMVLLNTMPGSGDTLMELLRTSARRIGVAIASSLTAGYLAPAVLTTESLSASLLLGISFAVGAGAQKVLAYMVSRVSGGKQSGASA